MRLKENYGACKMGHKDRSGRTFMYPYPATCVNITITIFTLWHVDGVWDWNWEWIPVTWYVAPRSMMEVQVDEEEINAVGLWEAKAIPIVDVWFSLFKAASLCWTTGSSSQFSSSLSTIFFWLLGLLGFFDSIGVADVLGFLPIRSQQFFRVCLYFS